MKKSCGKTVMKLLYNTAASVVVGYQIRLLLCSVWFCMNLRWCLCACFRWETIILISMYGIYIIIMK